VRALALVIAAAAVLALPASATISAGFAFGRHGGNIRPLEVRIFPTGRVLVNGEPGVHVTAQRLASLRRLVLAERFLSLRAHIVCMGVLPDVATSSVTAVVHGKTKTVMSRGRCNARFDHVYDALVRAAQVEGR
jgi:hypothetical protein